jgi:hypothetical protein
MDSTAIDAIFSYISDDQNSWIFSAAQAALLLFGFIFVGRQIRLARDQNSISHLNFFRREWNSEPLLRARLAVVQNSSREEPDLEGYEDVVASFLEDLGAAIRVGQVNTEHVWSYYSYHVDGYWMILRPKVEFYRQKTQDKFYFKGFEDLQKLSERISRKKGTIPMLESYEIVFRKEEEAFVSFLLNKQA